MSPTTTPSTGAADVTRPASGDHGYVAVVVGILLFVLAVMAAFAVDLGRWNNQHDRAQRAADTASLGAVSELVRVERDTGNRVQAEKAAEDMAVAIAAENGFDASEPDVDVDTTIWKDGAGVDHVEVVISQEDVDLYFAALVIDDKDIDRVAESALHNCQATCGAAVVIPSALDGLVDTGTGGDGWAPVLVDNMIFNLYHHKSGDVMMCIDRSTQLRCKNPAGLNVYPANPYPGMSTNYAPVTTVVDDRLYFIVQETSRVGLGCWNSTTHTRCAAFPAPLQIAPYVRNNETDSKTRFHGPERVGNRLFMYGDDNTMRCYDMTTGAWCAGYPKNMPLKGVRDMPLRNAAAGFAGGVNSDQGQQFDMLTLPDGRIFTTLTPASSATWIQCWDTNTDAACPSWPSTSTANGRPWLFASYDTAGTINGVCARGGNRGGSEVGSGHQCFTLTGTSMGSPLPYTFATGGTYKAGQQSATAVTSAGHTVTYFPFRNQSAYACWNWSLAANCSISASNWSNTQEYAYVADGDGCIYGLGHEGKLWSFSVDTGQFPCQEAGTAKARLFPCSCADGVNTRWTDLVLTPDTNLGDFDSFVVTLTRPDGTVLVSLDLTTTSEREIDLTFLNDETPPPAYLDLVVEAEVKAGRESIVFAVGNRPGVVQLPGIRPSLVR